MSIANWIAVVVPLLGLVGGAVVYMIQKTVDRQNQIRSERRALYRKLVVEFNNLNAALLRKQSDPPPLDLFIQYKATEAEIVVCAPDHVVEVLKILAPKMSKFAGSAVAKEGDKDAAFADLRNGYEAAVEEMRKDVLGETKVTRRVVRVFVDAFLQSLGRPTP